MGALKPTPTEHAALPFKRATFDTLAEALDYAARGETGFNFYNGRGELIAVLPFAQLREEAETLARKLMGLGLERQARVALVADTSPDFVRFFFACQYAGLVPVPLPIPFSLGNREAYIRQIRAMLKSCGASLAVAPEGFFSFLEEACRGVESVIQFGPPASFDALSEKGSLAPSKSHETAYLQYTSGSTRFPRGVVIRQSSVMENLRGIAGPGIDIRSDDRGVSWLPFYHDMGLVGLLLTPLACQRSVDFFGTREFAMRPRLWLKLMSENQASVSFGPPFGYELCEKRLKEGEASQYNLRRWRVAGVGAEMIRTEPLMRFAKALEPAGFDPSAFLPCYGMAECSLAVSFSPLGEGLKMDRVDAEILATERRAVPPTSPEAKVNIFADCGRLLPGFELKILDEEGHMLGEREIGVIYLRGPSVMEGYFNEPEMTQEALTEDGWLNTGDLGYRVGDHLFITGRAKDLIIINGRNIWPQDLEEIAERQPEVRTGDALAFGIWTPEGDIAVLVVECRLREKEKREALVERICHQVRSELGIDCRVEMVPPGSLPRTSSGKLSRSRAKEDYLASLEAQEEPWTPAAVRQAHL